MKVDRFTQRFNIRKTYYRYRLDIYHRSYETLQTMKRKKIASVRFWSFKLDDDTAKVYARRYLNLDRLTSDYTVLYKEIDRRTFVMSIEDFVKNAKKLANGKD